MRTRGRPYLNLARRVKLFMQHNNGLEIYYYFYAK